MAECNSGVPRPKPGPPQTIVQLKAGDSIDGIILSVTYWGVGTHWNDRAGKHGRSERCTADRGECSGCNAEMPCRWKGYLHVYSFAKKHDLFVELTPAVAEQIDMQRSGEVPLRGQRIKMSRGEGGNKTRIRVELIPFEPNWDTLPAEKDPEPILTTLWNWKR